MNLKMLLKQADARAQDNSYDVIAKPMSLRRGVFTYQSTTNDRTWTQKVIIPLVTRNHKLLLQALRETNPKLYCNCPSFKYHGYAYILSNLHNILQSKTQTKFPRITNPDLQGTVCKHLVAVLSRIKKDISYGYFD